MIKINYRVSGWISLALAILCVPITVLGIYAVILSKKHPEIMNLISVGEVLLTSLGIYVYIATKNLFENCTKSESMNLIINVLIIFSATNLIMPLMRTFGEFTPHTRLIVDVVHGVLNGAFELVFGVKTLKLSNNLFGYRNKYAYLVIVSSAMCMTFVLTPIAIITSSIASLYMAKMFFSVANET